ncbi:hypothetical protein GCM10025877_00480 [Agromyces mangrovi Wang et al. 2018]|nr:hypothetical protein GCM10025877_00480 [Agromyces mangrovi]
MGRGAVAALGALIDVALRPLVDVGIAGSSWWMSVASALPWVALGLVVWWWHERVDGARAAVTVFADVVRLLVGIAAAAGAALYGAGTLAWVLLRLLLDRSEAIGAVLDDLGQGIALLLIGALVWRMTHRRLVDREASVLHAEVFAVAGVAVIATAIGIGVTVNGGLAALVPAPLAGEAPSTTLLAGLAALAVGTPVWWLAWRPNRPVPAAEATSTGRRVFLVIVFGVNALVALISLLVIGYRVFVVLLDGPGAAGELLDEVRAPLGWLVATALVSAYHFAAWRADRRIAPAEPERRRVREVLLVAGGDVGGLARALRDAAGVRVTIQRRADAEAAPDLAPLIEAVERSDASRLLLVAGEQGVESVPLAE